MPSPRPRDADEHLDAATLYRLVEGGLGRSPRRVAEAHLERCDACTGALADVIRADRPATREEQARLAAIPLPSAGERTARLRPHIAGSAPPSAAARGLDLRPLAAAAVLAGVLVTAGLYVYERHWLPAITERAATETLATLVELRQGTGRIPLRYFREFDRASVTRSGFDTPDETEVELVESLQHAVERAPTPRGRLVLGLLLMDEGRLDEAEQHLEQAAEELPQSVDALNGLAVLHYERAQRNPQEAYSILQRGLALLRRAQALDTEDLRVMYNFGKFYEALEMTGAARQAWERYLRADDASPWAEEAAYRLAQLQAR